MSKVEEDFNSRHTTSNQISTFKDKDKDKDNDPAGSIRWFALLFGALTIFGPMYQYGLPISIETPIQNYFNINDTQYNLLYSLGALGMLFMPIIGGILTDYFGCHVVLLSALSIILAGQILSVISCFLHNYPLLIFSRFISMGLFDTMYIARYKMLTKLFYKRHIAIALGCTATFNKSSLIVNSILTPYIYEQSHSLTKTWMLGVGSTLISLLAACNFCCLEKKVIYLEKLESLKSSTETLFSANLPANNNEDSYRKINFADIKKLDPLVFFVAISGGISYSVFNAMYDNITAFFERKFDYSSSAASSMSTVFLVVALGSIFIHSALMSRFGKRNYFILISTIVFITSLIIFQALQPCNQCLKIILPLLLFGWYLGAYNVTIYSSMAFLVPKCRMGLAFGIVAITNNIFMVGLPIGFGAIIDASKSSNGVYDYTWVFLYLLFFAFFGLVFAILMFIRNIKLGNPLRHVSPCQATQNFENPLQETMVED